MSLQDSLYIDYSSEVKHENFSLFKTLNFIKGETPKNETILIEEEFTYRGDIFFENTRIKRVIEKLKPRGIIKIFNDGTIHWIKDEDQRFTVIL